MAEMNDMTPVQQQENADQGVFRYVIRRAIANSVYFIGGTVVIIAIGKASWTLGIILAALELVLAAIQALKVLLIVAADIAIFILRKDADADADEHEWRLASLVRVCELAVWIVCMAVLYRFFFG
jgi:hypothetical protein